MDNLNQEQRRKAMQAIKSKGTGIEKMLCLALWHAGVRYRKNCRTVLGKPDIVFRKYKIAVFCDSEFWHGKNYRQTISRIGTHASYWTENIAHNMKRDRFVNRELRKQGWLVIRFWGKDIMKKTDSCVRKVCVAIEKRRQS